jgi:hypothetical protein
MTSRGLFILAALPLLGGCAGAPGPAAPRLAQNYPTAAEPFVYDVKLPGYLICGGRDGTRRTRLKLPTGCSAVEFNMTAGLAMVLSVPDNSLARNFVHFYNADGEGLGWIELPRQPRYGANYTETWIADRPEAVVFIASGFGPKDQPGPEGKSPDTYYVSAEGIAAALGVARPLAVKFIPAGGYAIAGRSAKGTGVVRRYDGEALRWERLFPVPAGEAINARLALGETGAAVEFVLDWAGRRYAFDARGEFSQLEAAPKPAAP